MSTSAALIHPKVLAVASPNGSDFTSAPFWCQTSWAYENTGGQNGPSGNHAVRPCEVSDTPASLAHTTGPHQSGAVTLCHMAMTPTATPAAATSTFGRSHAVSDVR